MSRRGCVGRKPDTAQRRPNGSQFKTPNEFIRPFGADAWHPIRLSINSAMFGSSRSGEGGTRGESYSSPSGFAATGRPPSAVQPLLLCSVRVASAPKGGQVHFYVSLFEHFQIR